VVTFALVPYRNTARAIERVEAILRPTVEAHPGLEYELLVSDNSPRPDPALAAHLAASGLRFGYEWNGGRNLFYGGALNRLARWARYERLVYVCSNHGTMTDPTWLDDLLGALVSPGAAIAGSVRPCFYRCFGEEGEGIHVQGGLFAAKTELLHRHPYREPYLHRYSDIWLSRELLRAGHTLVDVATVGSEWANPVSDPQTRKIIHEGGS
jgi:hypothetical protein